MVKFKLLHREGGSYHLIQEDGKTAVCEGAFAGEKGYRIVQKKRKPLNSLICYNCRIDRKVRMKK